MRKVSVECLIELIFSCLDFGQNKKKGGLTFKELKKRVELGRKKATEKRLKEIQEEDNGPDFPSTGGLGMYGPGC